jgi:ribosomal protein S18 acetylase RimI-like enzyme
MAEILNTGSEIILREAEDGDALDLSRVMFAAFHEYQHLYTEKAFQATAITPEGIKERMRQGPVWVAAIGQSIAGTVSLVRRQDSLYIRGMAVHPACRGHRIGERLLHAAETYADENRCTNLVLSTTPFLTPAIGLYERFGFERLPDGPHELFGTPLFTMIKLLHTND